jgi:hypothetical protein
MSLRRVLRAIAHASARGMMYRPLFAQLALPDAAFARKYGFDLAAPVPSPSTHTAESTPGIQPGGYSSNKHYAGPMPGLHAPEPSPGVHPATNAGFVGHGFPQPPSTFFAPAPAPASFGASAPNPTDALADPDLDALFAALFPDTADTLDVLCPPPKHGFHQVSSPAPSQDFRAMAAPQRHDFLSAPAQEHARNLSPLASPPPQQQHWHNAQLPPSWQPARAPPSTSVAETVDVAVYAMGLIKDGLVLLAHVGRV